VNSRQCTLRQPTDVTALILNEARGMIPTVLNRVTPMRQVGLGVFKLTHDKNMRLLLFEDDSKMEYYREWDRECDAKKSLRESDRHHSRGREKVLTFSYKTGELALSAAKHAVLDNRSYFFARQMLPDWTDCFEVKDHEGKVIECHQVK